MICSFKLTSINNHIKNKLIVQHCQSVSYASIKFLKYKLIKHPNLKEFSNWIFKKDPITCYLTWMQLRTLTTSLDTDLIGQ